MYTNATLQRMHFNFKRIFQICVFCLKHFEVIYIFTKKKNLTEHQIKNKYFLVPAAEMKWNLWNKPFPKKYTS